MQELTNLSRGFAADSAPGGDQQGGTAELDPLDSFHAVDGWIRNVDECVQVNCRGHKALDILEDRSKIAPRE